MWPRWYDGDNFRFDDVPNTVEVPFEPHFFLSSGLTSVCFTCRAQTMQGGVFHMLHFVFGGVRAALRCRLSAVPKSVAQPWLL